MALDELKVGQQTDLYVQILNISGGSQGVTGATCSLFIYYPASNTTNWTYVAMSEVADGSGTYNATTPALNYQGFNRAVFNCSKDSVPYVTSDLISVIPTLTNESIASMNASIWNKVSSALSDILSAITSNLVPINTSIINAARTVNSSVLEVGRNATDYNASTWNKAEIIQSLLQNFYDNSSSNMTKLMTELLTAARLSYIDYLSTGGGYLVDANFVDDSEYTAPTCSISALTSINNTLKEGFTNTTLHFEEANRTILAELKTLNDTAKEGFSNVSGYNESIWNKVNSASPEKQGILLTASSPATVYTTENLTVYVSSTNSTSGQIITPQWVNVSIYYPNGSLYLNSTAAEARTDGTYRLTTQANITQGVYGIIVTAGYDDKTTATTSMPVRVSIEGNFDFKVDANSIGIIGHGVEYQVQATPMRGDSQYEVTIRCEMPEIANSAQQWNVLLTTGTTYTSEVKEFSLPKEMEKRHYQIVCELGYYDNGVPTTITATDSFLAHEKGNNILDLFAVRDILLADRRSAWAIPLLLIPIIVALFIRKRRQKGLITDDDEEEDDEGEDYE